MNKMRLIAGLSALCVVLAPGVVNAQPVNVVGTRAAGMGGAFVGVADDASAVYWNPAGLASGSYFSLLLDGGTREAVPGQGPRGENQSSFLLAASMPALGLSYYRISSSIARPDGDLPRVDTLVTHQAGLTFVQSVLPTLAVGSTVKMVRGYASSTLVPVGSAEEAFDALQPGLADEGTSHFDVDLGVMLTSGQFKAGFTMRNVREPDFATPDGQRIRLERQGRAGVSYAVFPGILVAADFDVLTIHDGFGERREAAMGVEGRLTRRGWIRSGFRFNTADDDAPETRKAWSIGGTFAATAAVLIDGVFISGGDYSGSGWGVSARFVY